MKLHVYVKASLIAPLLVVTLLAGEAQAAGSNLESISQLLNHSSAADKIQASNNPQALQKHRQALGYYQQATTADAAGDQAETKRLLDLAVRSLFEATRLAGTREIALEKKKRDFQAREESVGSLLNAFRQVAAEKNHRTGQQTERQVQSLLQRAESAAKNQEFQQGQESLDQAYELLQVALEELRGGETLVQSLNFASKADEYRYYVEKISSQRHAIDILVSQVEDPKKIGMVSKLVANAEQEQKSAQRLADRQDYDQAIAIMDKLLTRLQMSMMMLAQ